MIEDSILLASAPVSETSSIRRFGMGDWSAIGCPRTLWHASRKTLLGDYGDSGLFQPKTMHYKKGRSFKNYHTFNINCDNHPQNGSHLIKNVLFHSHLFLPPWSECESQPNQHNTYSRTQSTRASACFSGVFLSKIICINHQPKSTPSLWMGITWVH